MGIFLPFRSCDLDLDLMTFIYELDPYPLEMYGMCENKLPTSQLLKAVVNRTYRQTDTTEIIYHATLRVVKQTEQFVNSSWLLHCN